jgi:5-formyltetrahydrofolate cyclo-ligase
MPKNTLRQILLAKRKALTATEVGSASRSIQERFLASGEFGTSQVLALYAPIHNEVETDAVLSVALDAAKTVLYPVVNGESLEFRRVSSHEELQKGAFGIPEPLASCAVISPRMADFIVIPGVGFDLRGKRIGYGKGFYDKALHSLEGTGKFVGFCYDFQLVDEIVHEPHDVKLDLIITEKRVVYPRD